MDFTKMSIEELEARKAEIPTELEAEGADLDALEAEVRAINEEIANRKEAEQKRVEIRSAIAAGQGEVIQAPQKEERTVKTIDEIRNSKQYIDAFVNYIKTGDDAECRALLSENATNGTIAVPEYVYEITKTAWQREGIMSRVRKSYIKGNLKVGFEISGSDATVHTEGGGEVAEETLVLGVVNLVPKSIKKWISVSDEALDLRGEEFLRYIYDELTYRIAKKAADQLVAQIEACGTVSTTTCPGVPTIASTASLGTVAGAIANLSDDAANPVIIMNKLTWGTFKALQAAGNYGYDPFEGLPVVFNDTVTAYSAATTGDTYMIVGDLDQGALANFPNGEGINLKFDDITLATSDLVKVIGREFVGIGVVAPNAFVKVTK